MKSLRIILAMTVVLAMAALVALTGCSTSQQTVSYQTLSGLETATSAAYSAYIDLVVSGKVTTNDVPTVSHAFNDFQAAMVLATIAVQNNTNLTAPTNLVTEAAAVVTLINTIEGKKP